MEVLGPVWALIVAVPSGAIALLCAATVIWKVRHPFRASGRLALLLRGILGLVVGAIVFFAALLGGRLFDHGPLCTPTGLVTRCPTHRCSGRARRSLRSLSRPPLHGRIVARQRVLPG